ncbi:hypothetical protein BDN72DRAFT_905159 [Pluteus cervinus]|uniref:Uncharacterized protein n=1 Tax=Pluteus cervinus TaxID=181527 RepID=A0ACD3A3W7_9AGAR|nr:hypothetical protein BDN72DRAFT_905159 [Pluteus cervinus]
MVSTSLSWSQGWAKGRHSANAVRTAFAIFSSSLESFLELQAYLVRTNVPLDTSAIRALFRARYKGWTVRFVPPLRLNALSFYITILSDSQPSNESPPLSTTASIRDGDGAFPMDAETNAHDAQTHSTFRQAWANFVQCSPFYHWSPCLYPPPFASPSGATVVLGDGNGAT